MALPAYKMFERKVGWRRIRTSPPAKEFAVRRANIAVLPAYFVVSAAKLRVVCLKT